MNTSDELAALASSLAGTGSADDMLFADPQKALADALVRSSVQINARALREALFIREYCGDTALVEYILRMKNHQNPGALRRFTEAIKALALFEHLRGFNLNLGGK